MRPEDFSYFCGLLRDRSGLSLTQEKAYLVESRLAPVARKHAMSNTGELIQALKHGTDNNLAIEVTEAMTTNESFFFRDVKPFHLFRTVVIPKLLETRRDSKKIRIWSAACASGQEPYSLSIILREMESKIQSWDIEITGTDISTAILAKAKSGEYSQFEAQRGLSIQHLVQFFEQKGDRWVVKPDLKKGLAFAYFNLLEDPSSLGCFDVVFCRNVLIYFDSDTKKAVFDKIAKVLAPDGYLFLGGAETALGINDKFKPLAEHRGIYVHADQKPQ